MPLAPHITQGDKFSTWIDRTNLLLDAASESSGAAVDISVTDELDYFDSNNVEGVLEEIGGSIVSIEDQLNSLSFAAADIALVDAGNYFETDNVEEALQYLAAALDGLSAAASAITIVDSGNYYTGGNVETALQEVGASLTALSGSISSAAQTVATTNDTTTNATYYPVVVTATSGNQQVKLASTKLSFNPSTGTLTATVLTAPTVSGVAGTFSGTVSANLFTETSDGRLKTNVENLGQYLPTVNLLNPVAYDMEGFEKRQFGLIAQEVEILFPELVEVKKTDRYEDERSVNYSRLVPIMLKAIQELSAEVDKLKAAQGL